VEDYSGQNAEAIAGVSLMEDNFVVALGFGVSGSTTLTLNPVDAVRLETDSSGNMVLFPLSHPNPRIPKGDVSRKKELKNKTIEVHAGVTTAGYLFFPSDPNATRVTVIINIGKETFRFPFARNNNARAKFLAPDSPSVGQSMEIALPTNSNSPVATPRPSAPAQVAEIGVNIGRCEKNISFAVAEGGQVVPRVPKFAYKWVNKNGHKFPSMCFSQRPLANTDNYLLVFSTSQDQFNGLFPTVHTTTSTNTTPVSGSGTVTDYSGGIWQYTYSGTVTTTTTTTQHLDLPYMDTSNSLYLNVYSGNGYEVSHRWRTVTTRQGGDGMNTLGYNLGALLTSIHMKEGLLKDGIKDVQSQAVHRVKTLSQPSDSAVSHSAPPQSSTPAPPFVSAADKPLQPVTTPVVAPVTIGSVSVKADSNGASTSSTIPLAVGTVAEPEPQSLGDVARHYRELKQKKEGEQPQQ
jgi:hypothetical protein